MLSLRSGKLAKLMASAMQQVANRITPELCSTRINRRAFNGGSGSVVIQKLLERTGVPSTHVDAALPQPELEPVVIEFMRRTLDVEFTKGLRADGLLGVIFQKEARAAAVVEINCETGLVARNDLFQYLVLKIAKAALSVDSSPRSETEAAVINLRALEAAKINLSHPKLSGESTVSDAVAEVALIMGEEVNLRRGFYLSSATGIVGSYLHRGTQPGLARRVGLVTLEPASESQYSLYPAEVYFLGESLARHIGSKRPLFLGNDPMTREDIRLELDILCCQVKLDVKESAKRVYHRPASTYGSWWRHLKGVIHDFRSFRSSSGFIQR